MKTFEKFTWVSFLILAIIVAWIQNEYNLSFLSYVDKVLLVLLCLGVRNMWEEGK